MVILNLFFEFAIMSVKFSPKTMIYAMIDVHNVHVKIMTNVDDGDDDVHAGS